MFTLMAFYTSHALVLGGGGRKARQCTIMTCATILVGNVCPVGKQCGLVSLMALGTIGLDHLLGVGIVAIHTVGYLGVFVETIGTEYLGVLAFVGPELLDLWVVAGQTGSRLVTKPDLQRSVGVLVAGKTVGQLKVFFPLVALGTLRDVSRRDRLVPGVTIDAGHLRFVPFSRQHHIARGAIMTFGTVFISQLGPTFGGQDSAWGCGNADQNS
jgi:hypothetical protein